MPVEKFSAVSPFPLAWIVTVFEVSHRGLSVQEELESAPKVRRKIELETDAI